MKLYLKTILTCTSFFQLIQKFSSFGTVDVMPFAHRRVLVAVSSHSRLV